MGENDYSRDIRKMKLRITHGKSLTILEGDKEIFVGGVGGERFEDLHLVLHQLIELMQERGGGVGEGR